MGTSPDDVKALQKNLEHHRKSEAKGNSGVVLHGSSDTNAGNALSDSKPIVLKHRNVRTEYNGRRYDSIAEANRAAELDVMLKAKAIKFWIPQLTFILRVARSRTELVLKFDEQEAWTYRADFLVEGKDGKVWAEDVKGHVKQRDREVWAMWRKFATLDLHVIMKDETIVIEGRRKHGKWAVRED